MTKTRRNLRKPATRKAAMLLQVRNLQANARKAVTAGMDTANSLRDTVTGSIAGVRKQLAKRATKARRDTQGAVTQLERAFEARVERAMTKLGVPTTRDVHALTLQVAELQANVAALRRAKSRARAA